MLADSDALIASVKSGRLDAAVVVRPASGGSRRLDWRNLRSQPYVLLAPSSLAGRTTQEIMQRHDVIRYDPALTGGRIAARYLREVFPRAKVAMDVRSIDAIVAMVSTSLLLPRLRWPAVVGALAFMASDAILSFDLFKGAKLAGSPRWTAWAVWFLYFGGQAMITWGMLR